MRSPVSDGTLFAPKLPPLLESADQSGLAMKKGGKTATKPNSKIVLR
jgi:ribosomal protein S12